MFFHTFPFPRQVFNEERLNARMTVSSGIMNIRAPDCTIFLHRLPLGVQINVSAAHAPHDS